MLFIFFLFFIIYLLTKELVPLVLLSPHQWVTLCAVEQRGPLCGAARSALRCSAVRFAVQRGPLCGAARSALRCSAVRFAVQRFAEDCGAPLCGGLRCTAKRTARGFCFAEGYAQTPAVQRGQGAKPSVCFAGGTVRLLRPAWAKPRRGGAERCGA
jgi:hypothetical protein